MSALQSPETFGFREIDHLMQLVLHVAESMSSWMPRVMIKDTLHLCDEAIALYVISDFLDSRDVRWDLL